MRALPEVAPDTSTRSSMARRPGRRLEEIRVATGHGVRSIFFPHIPTVALKTVLKIWPSTGSVLWLGRHDVYHETNFLPLVRGHRAINTIYDLSYRTYPEFHPARRVWVYKSFERRMKDVAYIVTISEHARREIIEQLGVPEARVVTVYPGCECGFSPRSRPRGGRGTYPALWALRALSPLRRNARAAKERRGAPARLCARAEPRRRCPARPRRSARLAV